MVRSALLGTSSMRRLDGTARAFGGYAGAAVLSIVAAVLLLDLAKADLRVPFDYGGDALLYELITKSTLDHGWFWTNPTVGAPTGLEFYDFPASAHDAFHLLLIKAMSLFSGDWALLFNLYFLLGFPLITLSAMAVFRHFRIGYGASVVGAILYAFLPSRLLKGEGHIFMDVFYQVPLAILVLLWVCGDDPPVACDVGPRKIPFEIRRPRSWGSLLICALTASTCLYYAFFTGCLLVAGGIWASVDRRSPRNALSGILLGGAIVVGLAANGLPSIVYHLHHGANHQVAVRKAWEAEGYGMKVAQLLLPSDGHRIPAFRELKDRYSASAPLVGENGATSLGIVGGLGFLLLLGRVLSGRRERSPREDVWRSLAVLNLMAVLLGTIGGFGSLFAWLVSPQIRTYSRINVLIGFFSLFAVVLVLDRAAGRWPRITAGVLTAVLILGLLDQVAPPSVRPYENTKAAYESDADLVKRIEASVPGGTSVFQLPYVPFPEAAPVNRMGGYDAIRPYLHSSALRWSFPTMIGRDSDTWIRGVSALEPGRIAENVANAGFGGILVDRDGYVGDGLSMQAVLRAALAVEPLVSTDGRLAFFGLHEYVRRTHTGQSPGEVAFRQFLMFHPLAWNWDSGCYGIERDLDRTFRWCGAKGEVRVDNDTAVRRTVALRMTLVAAESPARLRLGGDLLSAAVDLAGVVSFTRQIDVPSGHHVIQFDCDGRRANAPGDPRTMVWRVEDFEFEELPMAPLDAK
jgi:phosphoglycerol transferase